jgi:hypothetical protein
MKVNKMVGRIITVVRNLSLTFIQIYQNDFIFDVFLTLATIIGGFYIFLFQDY